MIPALIIYTCAAIVAAFWATEKWYLKSGAELAKYSRHPSRGGES